MIRRHYGLTIALSTVFTGLPFLTAENAFGQVNATQQQGQFQQNAGQVQQPAGQPQQPIQQFVSKDASPQLQMAQQVSGHQPFPDQTPEQVAYIKQVLDVWSQTSVQIERYQCEFTRFTYDPQETNDPNTFASKAIGVIKHAPPDKGLFRVDRLLKYNGKKPDGQPDYKEFENVFGEWWLCDGAEVHSYDRNQKQVTVFPIPAELQGKEIVNSPLPFFFGVAAEDLQERFWIQLLDSPVGRDGKPRTDIITLEFYPKTIEDAQNYIKAQVFLDRADVLPAMIAQYLPEWTEKNNKMELYEFLNREKNPSQGLAIFRKEFIPMKPPKDWKVVVDPASQQQIVPQNEQQPDGLQQPNDRIANPTMPQKR